MSGKGKAKGGKAKGGKAKGGKAKAKSDGTFSFTAAKKPANRLSFAENSLTDNAESRQCAIDNNLTKKDWIAYKWSQEGRTKKYYAIRDPKGKCYAGLKDALDAHNGVKKFAFLCKQEDDDGNVCGLAKEACPAKTQGSNIACSCKKGKKHLTPSLDNMEAGITENNYWKLASDEDIVDKTKVTKRGVQSGLDTVTSNVSKIIEEHKDSLGEFKSNYAETIWTDMLLEQKFALDLLQKEQTLEHQRHYQQNQRTSDYTRLQESIQSLRSVIALNEVEEMKLAINGCKKRHSEQASTLDKLCVSFHSGQPSLDETGNVGNDRIKECQDKIQEYESELTELTTIQRKTLARWKRLQLTAVTEFNADKLAKILLTSRNEDDEKLVATFKMHARGAYERDPNTLRRNGRRAKNTINGTPVETLVTEAVHVVSTSLYLGRREKPDPVVDAISEIWKARKNSTPEEMATKIKAIIANSKQ